MNSPGGRVPSVSCDEVQYPKNANTTPLVAAKDHGLEVIWLGMLGGDIGIDPMAIGGFYLIKGDRVNGGQFIGVVGFDRGF